MTSYALHTPCLGLEKGGSQTKLLSHALSPLEIIDMCHRYLLSGIE